MSVQHELQGVCGSGSEQLFVV